MTSLSGAEEVFAYGWEGVSVLILAHHRCEGEGFGVI